MKIHFYWRFALAWSAGILLAGGWVSAQQTTGDVVTLADDTPVHMYLKDDLSSNKNNVNDPVHFQVREDIRVNGILVIPAGTPVRGHVIEVSRRGFAGHSGSVRFAVDSLTAPDGTVVLLRGAPKMTGGSVGKVVAGATIAYGPGALLMRGSTAEIHKGLMLNAYVDGERKITVAAASAGTTAAVTEPPAAPEAKAKPSTELQRRPEPQQTSTATPPAIVMVDPSVPASGGTFATSSSPLIIRGVVIDSAGLPKVTVNGLPAMLKPRSEQSAEFQSDPTTLQPGANRFEIIATNAAKAESRVSFIANYSPPGPVSPPKTQPAASPRALSQEDIIHLLKNDVSSARVAELVRQFGLKFSPTVSDLSDIRQAGGNDDLLRVIQQASSPDQ